MKLHTLIAAGLVSLSFALGSPLRAAEAPGVDSILTKYVEAMGGKAAMEKVKSRVTKMKLESESMPASEGEVYAKAPNKQASHIEISGTGTMDEGFDGTVAWAKTPWEGLRIKAGEELAKVKRDAELHRELKMKTLYPGLTYKGTEKVGDEQAYLLESKPTEKSTERLWFSQKTGLMIQQQSEFEASQGKVNMVIQAKDYKTFEGLKYPAEATMKYSLGDQSFEFKLKILEIKHNVPVDDAKFAKPAA